MTMPAPTPEDLARDAEQEYETLPPCEYRDAIRAAFESRHAWIRRAVAAEAELAQARQQLAEAVAAEREWAFREASAAAGLRLSEVWSATPETICDVQDAIRARATQPSAKDIAGCPPGLQERIRRGEMPEER